jgi:hypothetical protein
MKNALLEDIRGMIEVFQQTFQLYLPELELEINCLITNGCRNKNTIEHTLDTLLGMAQMGVGKEFL